MRLQVRTARGSFLRAAPPVRTRRRLSRRLSMSPCSASALGTTWAPSCGALDSGAWSWTGWGTAASRCAPSLPSKRPPFAVHGGTQASPAQRALALPAGHRSTPPCSKPPRTKRLRDYSKALCTTTGTSSLAFRAAARCLVPVAPSSNCVWPRSGRDRERPQRLRVTQSDSIVRPQPGGNPWEPRRWEEPCILHYGGVTLD